MNGAAFVEFIEVEAAVVGQVECWTRSKRLIKGEIYGSKLLFGQWVVEDVAIGFFATTNNDCS